MTTIDNETLNKLRADIQSHLSQNKGVAGQLTDLQRLASLLEEIAIVSYARGFKAGLALIEKRSAS